MSSQTMRSFLNNPLLNLLFFSFVLNSTWEWIQTPFFIDITSDLNTIVWYRIHCTLGDTLIMLAGYALISLYHKDYKWIAHAHIKHFAVLTAMGVIYTSISEYVNVYIKHNWLYSSYMPLLPVIRIGLIPLVQWIILPPAIVLFTKRQIKNCDK